jgi:hypothetical protein
MLGKQLAQLLNTLNQIFRRIQVILRDVFPNCV